MSGTTISGAKQRNCPSDSTGKALANDGRAESQTFIRFERKIQKTRMTKETSFGEMIVEKAKFQEKDLSLNNFKKKGNEIKSTKINQEETIENEKKRKSLSNWVNNSAQKTQQTKEMEKTLNENQKDLIEKSNKPVNFFRYIKESDLIEGWKNDYQVESGEF